MPRCSYCELRDRGPLVDGICEPCRKEIEHHKKQQEELEALEKKLYALTWLWQHPGGKA